MKGVTEPSALSPVVKVRRRRHGPLRVILRRAPKTPDSIMPGWNCELALTARGRVAYLLLGSWRLR